MFYRAWEEFNSTGALRSKDKNKNDIIRNEDGWVLLAEQECRKTKLQAFLSRKSPSLYNKIETFCNKYIDRKASGKEFTVRSLCNILKHNHVIQFIELYEPYDFWIDYKGELTNVRDLHGELDFHQAIYDDSNPSIEIGRVNYSYTNDLVVDIEFNDGDKFRYKDCNVAEDRLKISEVYEECERYFDALVDLYEAVYNDIYPQIQLLPSFLGKSGKPDISLSSTSVDLSKYLNGRT
ncbi:MAG: hypothetical protein PUF42_08410 [Firmicutes bacterium]|nr:hypothetical protein [Bacillota bacterium]